MTPSAVRTRRIAVIGAGWAGLAAAVQAVQQGAAVTVFEMAHAPGGRARLLHTPAGDFDNGQHILIGAYRETLALMRRVGADPTRLLLRGPLVLAYPDGRSLALPPGTAMQAFARAVLGARGWRWAERFAMLAAAGGWLLRGFDCPPTRTVQQLCAKLPAVVLQDLIEPLCVAALNTPMAQASAQVFLRVLRDALFDGRGSADLLLPRVSMSALMPEPAWRWLTSVGATCHSGRRVLGLRPNGVGWQVDDEYFDGVVLACSATEAARLAGPINPAWSNTAKTLRYEPIITAYLADSNLRLPHAMLALQTNAQAPAQFVFDLAAISTPCVDSGEQTLGASTRKEPLFAFVVSGAAPWVAAGLPACGRAILLQARAAFSGAFAGPDDQVLRHITAERRATFACTPGLMRPAMHIAAGLAAAGDYIRGPYPATLEGAVRSGQAAAKALE